MSEISTAVILDGITLALRAAFPDSKIRAETVEQGLDAPAFIVTALPVTQSPLPGGRFRRDVRFDVAYFPVAGKEECQEVAEVLFQILEVIRLPGGDHLRGSSMSSEIVDHVLHFLVAYHYNGSILADKTPMEELIIQRGGP